jgi:hypothetical protein
MLDQFLTEANHENRQHIYRMVKEIAANFVVETDFFDNFETHLKEFDHRKGIKNIKFDMTGISDTFSSLANVKKNYCTIETDKNGNLFSVRFHHSFKQYHFSMDTIYNNSFKFIQMIKIIYINGSLKREIREFKTLMSIEEELIFLKFYMNRENDILKEVLPEFFIESVYDFNSDAFAANLELAKMCII